MSSDPNEPFWVAETHEHLAELVHALIRPMSSSEARVKVQRDVEVLSQYLDMIYRMTLAGQARRGAVALERVVMLAEKSAEAQGLVLDDDEDMVDDDERGTEH